MELRQLRHFLAVMDHRSYGRAAQAASLLQQAQSHTILNLERELQVKLFDRSPFGAEFDLCAYLVSRYFGLRAYGRIYGAIFIAFAAGNTTRS